MRGYINQKNKKLKIKEEDDCFAKEEGRKGSSGGGYEKESVTRDESGCGGRGRGQS